MAGIDGFTKLNIPMDGPDASTTFVDNSGNGNVITANGNAQIDTAQSKFGGASGLFDGSGDALSIPDSPDWDFGTGDFTIDGWVRWNAISLSYVVCRGAEEYAIMLHAGQLRFRALPSDYCLYSFTPTLNQWYHIAVSRSGTTLRLFIDGTIVATDTMSTDLTFASSLIIGADGYGSFSGSLNGWIDELRISKGIARWTANFTPPTAAYSRDVYPPDWHRGNFPHMQPDCSRGIIIA